MEADSRTATMTWVKEIEGAVKFCPGLKRRRVPRSKRWQDTREQLQRLWLWQKTGWGGGQLSSFGSVIKDREDRTKDWTLTGDASSPRGQTLTSQSHKVRMLWARGLNLDWGLQGSGPHKANANGTVLPYSRESTHLMQILWAPLIEVKSQSNFYYQVI